MSYGHTTTLQQHLPHPLEIQQLQDQGAGSCSENNAMLLDGVHRGGGQLRSEQQHLRSEQQHTRSGEQQHLPNSLYDWDINDPDIPAKVHLYVSTGTVRYLFNMQFEYV